MLLVLVLSLALILLPALLLRAIHKREAYCGKGAAPCFLCHRQCEYYNLRGTK